MELIVISNEKSITNEAEIINGLFGAGMSRFHLRKPHSTKEDVCLLLDKINPAFRDRIALHQFHDLAPAYGITRLHFTEQVRRETALHDLNALSMQGFSLSTSIHDAPLISSLQAFQYVFFGPVFNSLSKPGYNSNIETGFRIERIEGGPKVIALGGIETHRIATAKSMGFDGVAVLGALWKNPALAVQNFEHLKAFINTKQYQHDQ